MTGRNGAPSEYLLSLPGTRPLSARYLSATCSVCNRTNTEQVMHMCRTRTMANRCLLLGYSLYVRFVSTSLLWSHDDRHAMTVPNFHLRQGFHHMAMIFLPDFLYNSFVFLNFDCVENTSARKNKRKILFLLVFCSLIRIFAH